MSVGVVRMGRVGVLCPQFDKNGVEAEFGDEMSPEYFPLNVHLAFLCKVNKKIREKLINFAVKLEFIGDEPVALQTKTL